MATTASVFLKPSFGNLGVSSLSSVNIDDTLTNHFAVTPSGSVYVGGYVGGGTNDFGVMRYSSSGVPDPTFAGGGFVRTVGNGNEYIEAIALQADGKLVAGGGAFIGSGWHYQLVRYLSDGSLDSSFGDGGIVVSAAYSQIASVLRVLPDGEIIVNNSIAFNSSGVLDGGYVIPTTPLTTGQGGVLSVPAVGGVDFYSKQNDGTYFLGATTAGMGNNGTAGAITLWHLRADGGLDTTFGLNGKVNIPFADWVQIRDARYDGSGHVIVVGSDVKNGIDETLVFRLSLNGSLDKTFSDDGVFEISGVGRGAAVISASDKELMIGSYKWDGGANRALVSAISIDIPDTTPPAILSTSPYNLGKGIAVNSNIVITFNERVQKGVGVIELHKDSIAGAVVDRFFLDGQFDPTANNGLVSIEGSTITLNPRDSLLQGTDYYLSLGNGVVKDLSNNSFAGLGDLHFSTVAAPVLPIFSFVAASGSGLEGHSGSALVRVPFAISSPVSVGLDIPISYSGSATPGVDYSNNPSSVHISVGQSNGYIEFNVLGDVIDEKRELVTITLGDSPSLIVNQAPTLEGEGWKTVGSAAGDYISVVNPSYTSDIKPLEVNGGGGNDFLVWRGGYATSFDGGAGYDVLVLNNEITKAVITDQTSGAGYLDFNFGSGSATVSFTNIEGLVYWRDQLPAGSIVGNLSVTLNSNFTQEDYSSFISNGFGGGLVDYPDFALATHIQGKTGSVFNYSIQNDDPLVYGKAYHWNSHVLLADTGISAQAGTASPFTGSSDVNGDWHMDAIDPGNYALSATRSATDTSSTNAITSADALAALRLAVGLNPNAGSTVVSPYQFMAADVVGATNGGADGKVTAADALAILRMAVKLPSAPANEWMFVEDTRDFWDETTNTFTIDRSHASWDKSIAVNANADQNVNLVGILKGDVNGSWAAPANTPDLDNINTHYFTDLQTQHHVPLAQMGVLV